MALRHIEILLRAETPEYGLCMYALCYQIIPNIYFKY